MPTNPLSEKQNVRIREVTSSCRDENLADEISRSLIATSIYEPKNFERYSIMYNNAIKKWKL